MAETANRKRKRDDGDARSLILDLPDDVLLGLLERLRMSADVRPLGVTCKKLFEIASRCADLSGKAVERHASQGPVKARENSPKRQRAIKDPLEECLLARLPNETLFVLFQQLGTAGDVLRLGATCRAMYARIADSRLWERLYCMLPGTVAHAMPIAWGRDHRWLYHARTSTPSTVIASLYEPKAKVGESGADIGEGGDDCYDVVAMYSRMKRANDRLLGECVLTTTYGQGVLQYHGQVDEMMPCGYGIMVALRDGAVGRPAVGALGGRVIKIEILFKVRKASPLDGLMTDHLRAGDWFEGLWSRGALTKGRARFHCTERYRYEGRISRGKLKGHGTLTDTAPDGDKGNRDGDEGGGRVIYEGEWRDSAYHGWTSHHQLPNGSLYVGMMHEGKRHGWGTTKCGDGETYEGNYVDDIRCGWGTLTHSDGERHVGNFARGKANGWGTLYLPCGSVFEGYFKDGGAHGRGTLRFKSGTIVRSKWKNGKSLGYKVTHGPLLASSAPIDGDSAHCAPRHEYHYMGFNKYGLYHGKGIYEHASGWRFEGTYKDNERDGFGTYVHEDGSVEFGIWNNGKLSGGDPVGSEDASGSS